MDKEAPRWVEHLQHWDTTLDREAIFHYCIEIGFGLN